MVKEWHTIPVDYELQQAYMEHAINWPANLWKKSEMRAVVTTALKKKALKKLFERFQATCRCAYSNDETRFTRISSFF